MTNPTDDELDELLSGGYLSGPQYDRIFGQVLRHAAPASRNRNWRAIVWALVPATTVLGGWLLFARMPTQHFTARGGGTALAGQVMIGCGRPGHDVCRLGDTLMFEVNAAVLSGFLGAYADPATAGAQRIWYFPNDDGRAPFVERGSGMTVLREGIRIGPEHGPGLYRISLSISDHLPTREGLGASMAGAEFARWTVDLHVVP